MASAEKAGGMLASSIRECADLMNQKKTKLRFYIAFVNGLEPALNEVGISIVRVEEVNGDDLI